MSELRTNRIVPRDGLPSGSFGGITQIKWMQLTGSTFTTQSTSMVDVTNFNLSITPTRSDSKIMVCVNCTGCGSRAQDTRWTMRIKRNGSYIRGVANYIGLKGESGGEEYYPSCMFLDSPATTSAVTYTLHGDRTGGSSNCYFNHQDGTGATTQGSSTMTLMEVSG